MTEPTSTPVPGGFGPDPNGGGGSVGADVYSRYIQGQATDEDLNKLIANGDISLETAHTYAQKRDSSLDSLKNDLAGLVPVDTTTGEIGYPAESPIGRTSVEAGHAIRTYADPQTGIFYDANGKVLPQYMQKFLGRGGGSTTSPETIRQNRIAEVMAAQNAIEQRIQNAQQARLAGAKMAITPDMAASGYFPSLGPNSPIVRAGLADPFRFQPVPFSADQGLNINQDQVAKDLAMVRSLAGYGG